jgi:hypothetical protein
VISTLGGDILSIEKRRLCSLDSMVRGPGLHQ